MNLENSKTSKRHVLILNITDKIDLRRGEKRITLLNLSIYYTWKKIKTSYNNNKFKIQMDLLQHGMMNLNYQMDHT